MAHNCDGQGDRQSAIQYYQQSVDLYRQVGDRWAISHPLCDLAWKIWDQGFTQQARSLMEEHLATFRTMRMYTRGLGMALQYMMFISTWMGDFDSARRCLEEYSMIDPITKTEPTEAWVLSEQGYFDFVCGRLGDARRKLESALSLARGKTDYTLTCFLLHKLGNLLVYEGRRKDGLALLEECLSLMKQVDYSESFWSMDILADYAAAVFNNNNLQHAQALFRQNLENVRHSLPKVPRRVEGLAQIAQALGNCERAARLLGAAHNMRETMTLPVLPIDREDYERGLARLREDMGEQAFQQAWNVGTGMAVGDCIEYALVEG